MSASSLSGRVRNKLQKVIGTRGEIDKVSDFIKYMASSSNHRRNLADSTLTDYHRTFGSETLCLSVGRDEKSEINFAFLSNVGGMSPSTTPVISQSGETALSKSCSIPTYIVANDLGEKIGSGADKDVYQLKTNQALVIALQRHDGYFSPDPKELYQEIALLNQLAEKGFPVIQNYGVVKVGDRHGLLQDHIPRARVQYEPGVIENLNQQSLSDLDRIESLLAKNNIHIDDFQLLVGSDGRVYVVDPLRVEIGFDEANQAAINDLKALCFKQLTQTSSVIDSARK